MNKYNRRSRPNLRYTCEFWTESTVITESGERQKKFTLHYKGPFALEVPQNAVEITDAGQVQSEQVFIAIGQWAKPAATITAGMFCKVSSLQKVFAVLGNAKDPWGDRKKIHVRLVDNLQDIPSALTMNTAY